MPFPELVLQFGFGFVGSQCASKLCASLPKDTAIVVVNPQDEETAYRRVSGGMGRRITGSSHPGNLSAIAVLRMNAWEAQFAAAIGQPSRDRLIPSDRTVVVFESPRSFADITSRWQSGHSRPGFERLSPSEVIEMCGPIVGDIDAVGIRLAEGKFPIRESLERLRDDALSHDNVFLWSPPTMPKVRREGSNFLVTLPGSTEERRVRAVVIATGSGLTSILSSFELAMPEVSLHSMPIFHAEGSLTVRAELIERWGHNACVYSRDATGSKVLPLKCGIGLNTPRIEVEHALRNFDGAALRLPSPLMYQLQRSDAEWTFCGIPVIAGGGYEPAIRVLAPGLIAVVATRATFSTHAAAVGARIAAKEFRKLSGQNDRPLHQSLRLADLEQTQLCSLSDTSGSHRTNVA